MGINDVLNKNTNEVITKYVDKVKGKKQEVNNYIKENFPNGNYLTNSGVKIAIDINPVSLL